MAAPGAARGGLGALTWGLLGLLHLAGVLCSDADALLQVQPQVHPQVNLQVRAQVHPHGDAQVELQVQPQVDGRDRLKVRLVNGSSRCVGRVEVLHRNRWGSVCDDTWDMADAQVICRSLGCGSALAAPGHAHFGQGAGPIWLDGTHCTGEELTLARCRLHTWGQHDCGHGEDAGAVCSGADPPQVRLRGGAGPCSGQVQVLLNRTWLQVCGLTWGPPEAQVLCRQLGCGPALSAPAGPHLQEQGPRPAQPHLSEPHLLELTCRGSEQLLIECPRLRPGTCGTGAVANVACEEPPAPPDPCSLLGALLGVGAGLCGALLGLYLCTRCARCASGARGPHPPRGRTRPGEPLLPPEQPGTAGETSADQHGPV
ncbi:deleted in malignant brain tumors 1 protein-like [Ammospiza caudacuta]|uniref:deleted in malignant brain tumors 1 protein-like n=1 Tax=Ammospiza caudacuta TaxID=2857398 RepID=UPI002739DAC5|nr:deleted in malignant brain tumors 1 protein-like [Ammospiza caudacuta]